VSWREKKLPLEKQKETDKTTCPIIYWESAADPSDREPRQRDHSVEENRWNEIKQKHISIQKL